MKRLLIAFGFPVRSTWLRGHFRSALLRKSVDAGGNPIPWYTYPAIDLLSTLDFQKSRVLEFGGGQSTMWWAIRAASVTTMESDPNWYQVVASKTAAYRNVSLRLEPDPDLHARSPIGEQFDIVIVDGGERYLCARTAVEVLAERGMIIVDDSQGYWGPEGSYPIIDLMHQHGFERIDLYGFAPGVWHTHCTSLFFRRDEFPSVLRGQKPPVRESDLLGTRSTQ
jgi:hypothetical protein